MQSRIYPFRHLHKMQIYSAFQYDLIIDLQQYHMVQTV
nr:MAG TPA: hypothetical protein [Caudoviricetes sp.]